MMQLSRRAFLASTTLLAVGATARGAAIVEPGCAALGHVDEAHAAVASFRPLAPAALAEIERRAGPHRGKTSEWYKDA